MVRSVNLHDFDRLPFSNEWEWISTFHRQALTILYFHTAIIRSSSKPYLAEYWSSIKHSLSLYYPISFFYIENFWKTEIIMEFITLRKLSVLRMIVPYFIKIACKRVYNEEEEMITEYWNLCDEFPDSPDQIILKLKGSSRVEATYETIKIKDHRDKIKEAQELIIYLYDNKHSIPLLVIFANKLLKLARDFYEDIETTQKYHALSNFFELFYAISESGPEMKRYMIANKFIGRLLDFYKYKTTSNQHYTRDLSYLPTYERVWNERKEYSNPTDINISAKEESDEQEYNFDFGLKYIKQKISQDDLVVEKSKKGKENKNSDDDSTDLAVLKGSKEGDDKRFAYLLRTVSSLVCSWRFKYLDSYIGQDSMFLNTPNPNVVPDSEEKVIEEISSDDMIKEFIIRSSLNISTKEDINCMYSHLSWENDDVTTRLLKLLISDIWNSESTFITVIKHTDLMINISRIKDKFSTARMEYLIKNLYEQTFIKAYPTYVKYSDSLLNMIMMIIRRNYDACKYMRELEDPYSHIQKFIEKNPFPKATGSNQVLFRGINGNERIDRYFYDEDRKVLSDFWEYRLQVFKELLIDIDWEDHIQRFIQNDEVFYDKDKIYSKGDIVDYYKEEYSYWIQANVLEDYGPIMQVSYKIPSVIANINQAEEKPFVKINKDSIRSFGIYTQDMHHRINGLYSFLYSVILEKERSYRRKNY